MVYYKILNIVGFPGGSVVKNLPVNAGDLGSIPGSGRSLGEGNGKPLQYSCLEIPWMEESAGYSPWGHKELDMTERLHFHFTFKKTILMYLG